MTEDSQSISLYYVQAYTVRDRINLSSMGMENAIYMSSFQLQDAQREICGSCI